MHYLFWLFAVVMLGFAVVYGFKGKPSQNIEDFFHQPEQDKNIRSLVVANITVSTGIAYLLVSGQMNGLLFLLIPVALLAGYALLRIFLTKIVASGMVAGTTFFKGAHNAVARHHPQTKFAWFVVLPILTVFFLFTAYEVFVSAQVLAGLIFPQASVFQQISIATVLYCASLGLVWARGAKGVLAADAVQFYAIALFTVALVVAGIAVTATGNVPSLPAKSASTTMTPQVWINIALAVLSAITTQFSNLLNHHTISNLSQGTQTPSVLRKVSWWLAGFFALMILIGAMSSIDWQKGLVAGMAQAMAGLPVSDGAKNILAAILIVGLGCVVMSTLDSLMLALTMYSVDHFGNQSANNATPPTDRLNYIRNRMAIFFVLSFVITASLFFGQPNIFYLLLALASGLDVMVPLIVLIGFVSKQPAMYVVMTNRILFGYAFLFISAMLINITLSSYAPHLVPYIALAHFIASVVFSLMIWNKAKKHKL
jgi:hypothetical protein